MRSQRLWEIRKRVLEELRRLAGELGAVVYLFGSYARGDFLLDSDVDIVVVSSRFEGVGYLDRVAAVRALLPPDIGFDIIALTPREFEERLGLSFYREISKYWVKIEP